MNASARELTYIAYSAQTTALQGYVIPKNN
jgi:hypothetical protein